jgi:glyoxylase-like metal-dependent hydrolase (beta-lactamase superfamily II)
MRYALLSMFVVCAAGLPAAAQDFDKVEIETQKLAEGVYMLTGAGGNIGVSAGADGVVLIDDQYAPLTDKIRAAVAALDEHPIRFVLNTHWHGDHTGGTENLGRAGAVVVAHENVRRRMSVEQLIEAFGRSVPASPPAALPVVTFTRDVTFHLNGDELYAFHVEHAHTDGDTIVHFRRADVIHMGDTLFNGMYPFIDISSGGSIDGVIAAADAVLAIAGPQTRIVAGHGPLAGRAELTAYRDMLRTVRERVEPLRAAGKTLEEVVAAKPTEDLDGKWGGGFIDGDRFVSFVYDSLAR